MFSSFMRLALVALMACPLTAQADGLLKSGLFFRSFEVNKDMRTGLNLTPGKPLALRQGFTMSFDIKLRIEPHNFGYVFRIVGNDTLNIDFLSNLTPNTGERPFSLVVKNRALLQFAISEAGPENGWMKVRLELNTAAGRIKFALNGTEKEIGYPLDGLKTFQVFFGGNMHGMFSTTDIAPMSVREIEIHDAKGDPVRYWKLGKHLPDGGVLDECASHEAVALHPVWEIDSHAQWKKMASLVMPGTYYHTAFDPAGNRIFLSRGRSLFAFHTGSRRLDTVHIQGSGIPFSPEPNQLLYDSNRNQLLSYSMEEDRTATFDFATQKWDKEENSYVASTHWHHNKAFLAADSAIFTFGGYGFHTYHGTLHRHAANKGQGAWERWDIAAEIAPRYLASMGFEDDTTLLLFGGFGNKSGKQEEFPHNYYDLYAIQINRRPVSIRKRWELSAVGEHFTNSNSLIVDRGRGKFYALAYPNNRYATTIRLHEYEPTAPVYKTVGDAIPYYFNDVESYCDLFQKPDSTELYALTSHTAGGNSEVEIYSIAYPPLSPDEVYQPAAGARPNRWLPYAILSAAVVALLVLCPAVYLRKRRRAKQQAPVPENSSAQTDGEAFLASRPAAPQRFPAVLLLGRFQLINSEGIDMAPMLTPTTLQLFLLLWIPAVKDRKGVASKEIQRILWNDKEGDSARNNRNVYINKLRFILKGFKELKVASEGGLWTVEAAPPVFCDYGRALTLIISLQKNFRKEALAELLDLSHSGQLLPGLPQADWLESCQSEYTALVIENLLAFAQRKEVQSDLAMLLKIACVILLHDNIDEEAIRLKCYALFHTGRKKQALQAYNKFKSDYEALLATPFPAKFEDLV